MRKSLLIKIHLYCGLFTLFYLVAFGLSSIILNHDLKVEKRAITRSWNQHLKIDPTLMDKDLAKSVKSQLNIMGWELPWKFERDSVSFYFQITHTGRNYYLNVNLLTGEVVVDEAPKGFLAVLHGLHFFNGMAPNAPFFIRTWAVYQWLTLFTMLISIVVGLWLWLKYNYRRWVSFASFGPSVLAV